ncbi:MAG: alcohol dehydrogenase catalytic domain-containing protein [Anaerolineae bacterium]|nr:alcohol dehydrogenase catalytic domain-containing protein [Anaerolineae bacterium]
MHRCDGYAHLLKAIYNNHVLTEFFDEDNFMASTMKAAIYAGAGDIRIEDYPMPDSPGMGELLVRVKACGVCGSDVTDWYMTPRAPVVLGHEPAGDVVAVGEGVTQFKVGDRVALHHHVPCMVCDFCMHGHYTQCPTFKKTRLYPAGMAEYVRIPAEIVERDILRIPDGMPYEVAALVEPIACCVRALDRAEIQQGDTVVIVGAGFNGIVMAMLAPMWGANKVAILDRLPVRLERARSMGLKVFNVDDADLNEQIKQWTEGVGPHAVMVTASNEKALNMAFDLCSPGGTLLLYAPTMPDFRWGLNTNRILFQEINVKGTYSAGPFDTRRTMAMLKEGLIDANLLITHRFSIDEADKAWHLTKAAGDSLKVMVEFS